MQGLQGKAGSIVWRELQTKNQGPVQLAGHAVKSLKALPVVEQSHSHGWQAVSVRRLNRPRRHHSCIKTTP